MSKSRGRRILLKFIRIIAGVYFGAVLLVFIWQRRLIYQPSKVSIETVKSAAEARGFEPWRDPEEKYIGWKQTASVTNASRASLLIVHGNAGCAADRLDYADSLEKSFPADVYILEYPGYGARDGSPSQSAFYAATDDALASMPTNRPVYLFGESLGTGVVAHLAGTHPGTIAGVLLLAPYHDLAEVAASHFPWLPVKLLILDHYRAADDLANYHGPVAVLLAGRDVIVPNRFGHELFDGYHGPKKLWMDDNAEHNDLAGEPEPFWSEVANFWTGNQTK
jgi:pimeloyl-ACP methyl ester carboxylesterase